MKRAQFIFGILCLLAVGVRGEVPSTLTYQGRLYKGGIGAAGKKLMSFALVNSSGATPLGSFNVDVPVTGEFSVSIPLPVDYDWAGNPPKLEVSVDGEKLSPLEIFSVTPYSLVTKKVDINGVDTGALKDEAVTTEKIKSLSAEKVLLGSGQPIGRWEKGTTGFIDASVIVGTVPASVTEHGVTHRAGGIDPITELSPSQINGTGMVLKPMVSQTVEPVGAATDTFVVKGSLGASEDKFYPLRVYGTQTPKQEEQFSIRGDGQTYFKGKVGVGTKAPSESLTVEGTVFLGGNVGIGTPPTDKKLTVQGDLTTEGQIESHGGRIKDRSGFVSPVGGLMPYAGTTPPDGWLVCNGTAVSRVDYAELYNVIGTTYGSGDGSTTFNLPDLRGRSPIGSGQGVGLTNRLVGQIVGEETHKLTVSEMPSHSHKVKTMPSYDTTGGFSGGGWYGDPIVDLESTKTGGDQPHNIMQPSIVLNFIIKY